MLKSNKTFSISYWFGSSCAG